MIETAFPGVGHGIFDKNCEKMTSLEIEGFLKQTRETMLTYMGVVCNYEICGRSISEYRDAYGFLIADSKEKQSFYILKYMLYIIQEIYHILFSMLQSDYI